MKEYQRIVAAYEPVMKDRVRRGWWMGFWVGLLVGIVLMAFAVAVGVALALD